MSTYVYRYGLSAPLDNDNLNLDDGITDCRTSADLVWDQLRAAHRYGNTLVEIERGRRAALRGLLSNAQPEIVALTAAATLAEARVIELAAAIKKERASTRKRSETKASLEELKAARVVRWEAVKLLREARFNLKTDPHVASETARINGLANELRKGARALTACHWGSYLLIEEAAMASAEMPLFGDDGVSPNDPRFERWTGEGNLGVQLQGGTPANFVLTGDSTQLHAIPDERAYLDRACDRRRVKGSKKSGMLKMRVGSTDKGKPVWASWHLDMHRLLPKDAIVKRAAVHVRKVGHSSEWSCTITVDHTRATLPPNARVVAIDVGWRQIGDDIRVAGWMDSSGHQGDVRLSKKTIALLKRPAELRSERDHWFGIAKLRLGAFLLRSAIVPEWLKRETASLERWGSADRLSRLFERWDVNRFDGDAPVWNELMAWYHRDRHLNISEASIRLTALRRRKSFYRKTAAWLTDTYGTIVVEQFDLRGLARRPKPDDAAENETARSNRQLVAVSELRTAIVQAAASRGRIVAAMPAGNTTRKCPSCGKVEKRDAALDIVVSCSCGHVWDQDVEGAPVVLLAAWRERPGDGKILVGAREEEKLKEGEKVKETRQEKRARGKANLKVKKEGARKKVGEPAE